MNKTLERIIEHQQKETDKWCEHMVALNQIAAEQQRASIDCRICQHYCETNGCEVDDCDKGSDFRKSATLRLWEYQT